MKRRTVADSYASSLFEIAHAERALDRVEKDLDNLKEILRSQRDLVSFLRDRGITPEGKRKALREILNKDISPIVLNKLDLLIEHGREGDIQRMVEAFENLVSAEKKKATATITTAIPLREEEREKIERELAEATGKSIRLKTRVDKAILGGAIIRINERVIDASLQKHLNDMRESMTK